MSRVHQTLRPPAALDPHRPARAATSTRRSPGTASSRRSSCSTGARTPSATAPGSASPTSADKPFILVLAQFFPATDPFKGTPQEILAPFAHLGIELTSRDEVDEMAARGEAAGCLAMPPTEMPPPIGYICMLRDPDGNMVEFSFDQGVYAKAQEVWGVSADRAARRTSPAPTSASFAAGDPDAIAAHVSRRLRQRAHRGARLGLRRAGRVPPPAARLPRLDVRVCATRSSTVVADGSAVAVDLPPDRHERRPPGRRPRRDGDRGRRRPDPAPHRLLGRAHLPPPDRPAR